MTDLHFVYFAAISHNHAKANYTNFRCMQGTSSVGGNQVEIMAIIKKQAIGLAFLMKLFVSG